MKKNESKYFYSAMLMNNALLALLDKKDIAFISVTEITKKAGVNRSTFYLHYDNVYELLEETISNLNKKFISSFDIKKPIEIKSKDDAVLVTSEFLVPYLNFCKENRKVMRLIRKNPLLFNNKIVYEKMYQDIFYPAISQFIESEDDRIFTLEFYTNGVVAIIYKWLELDCITEIEKLVEIILRLVKKDKT